MLKKSKWLKKKKKIYDMLNFCTSSWNVSWVASLHRRHPEAVGGGGQVSVLWMLCLSRVCVSRPAQSGGPLNCTFPHTQTATGPLSQPRSLFPCSYRKGEAHFKRYSLKKNNKQKKILKKVWNLKEMGKRLPFRTLSPSAHKQKSLLPVSVTALIQAQTDPIAEDLPAFCTDRRTLTAKGVSHAAPALRGSPLHSSLDTRSNVFTACTHLCIQWWVSFWAGSCPRRH